MTAIRLAASTILIFSLGIHAASNPIDDGQNDAPSVRLIFAVDPFAEPIGYSFLNGNAKEKVLSRFGKPIEEQVVTAYSPYPTFFPYNSYEIRYKDVLFTVGKWPDREHSWIERIEITGNTHKLKSGVRIGSTRDEIAAAFSPPEHAAQANPMGVSISYYEKRGDIGSDGSTVHVSGGMIYTISFEFDNEDRVRKISISWSTEEIDDGPIP